MNVLLAITGGIAAYKAPKVVSLLVDRGCSVRVIATRAGLEFVSPLTLAALSGSPVLSSMFTDGGDYQMNHIRLPEWADLFLVCPASADVLAKTAHGIADDLVTTTLCAAGSGQDAVCPVVYAPAMNTRMWRHAATQANVERIREWGGIVLDPESGKLACSDVGEGRMPEPEAIVSVIESQGLLKPKHS